MQRRGRAGVALAALFAFGCGSGTDDPASREAQLNLFRDAIPANDVLKAQSPGDSAGKADGHLAEFPPLVKEEVTTINGLIQGQLSDIHALAAGEPAELGESRAVWGPLQVPGDIGWDFLVVERAPGAAGDRYADLPFRFRLVVSADETLDTTDAAYVRGASSGRGEGSIGFLVFDLDKLAAFYQANDPQWDPTYAPAGAAVAVYANDLDVDGDKVRFVATRFKDFVSGEVAGDPVTNANHFYGRYLASATGQELSFFDFLAEFDYGKDGTLDLLSVRLGHFDGEGRAEAELVSTGGGGGAIVECWDEGQTQTLWLEDPQPGDDQSACGEIFKEDLTTLGVPGLDDVDVDEIADCLSTGGAGATCD